MKRRKLSEELKVEESEFVLSMKKDCFGGFCFHFPNVTHGVLKQFMMKCFAEMITFLSMVFNSDFFS